MFGPTLAGMQSILICLIFNCVIVLLATKASIPWNSQEELPFQAYKKMADCRQNQKTKKGNFFLYGNRVGDRAVKTTESIEEIRAQCVEVSH